MYSHTKPVWGRIDLTGKQYLWIFRKPGQNLCAHDLMWCQVIRCQETVITIITIKTEKESTVPHPDIFSYHWIGMDSQKMSPNF